MASFLAAWIIPIWSKIVIAKNKNTMHQQSTLSLYDDSFWIKTSEMLLRTVIWWNNVIHVLRKVVLGFFKIGYICQPQVVLHYTIMFIYFSLYLLIRISTTIFDVIIITDIFCTQISKEMLAQKQHSPPTMKLSVVSAWSAGVAWQVFLCQLSVQLVSVWQSISSCLTCQMKCNLPTFNTLQLFKQICIALV